jgi:hypothetical protein
MKNNRIDYKKISLKVIDLLRKRKETTVENKNANPIILGDGAIFDSIGVVSFFMEIERSVKKITKKNFIIRINAIHEVNKGKNKLTLNDFCKALSVLENKK